MKNQARNKKQGKTGQHIIGEEILRVLPELVESAIKSRLKCEAGKSLPLSSYPLRMRRDQVALYFNCSANHVQNMIDAGLIEAVDLASEGRSKGRACLRVCRLSIERFERGQTK